jgi:hypothetical protein
MFVVVVLGNTCFGGTVKFIVTSDVSDNFLAVGV